MNEHRRSFWTAMVALAIILIGLFLVCAQRRAMVSGDSDISTDDEKFRQELLQLLDMASDDEGGLKDDAADTMAYTQDDVLSLLVAENEQQNASTDFTSPPSTTADNMGLSQEMFTQIRNDVERLEKALGRRNTTADSIKSIIANRDNRIKELESRVGTGTAKPGSQTTRTFSGPTSTAGRIPAGFKARYDTARRHFERFQYEAAISAFQGLIDEYTNAAMADNCQYWVGECYFGLKEYQKAIIEFQKVFAYSKTDKYDDAQIMIGMCYMRSGQQERAQQEFETFLNNYKGSEYTSIAQKYYRNI